MPELPEVETIKTDLEPYLTGRIFTSVRIYDTRPVQKLSPDEFCSRLTGQKILGLTRRGKYIILNLSAGDKLVVHLRMTGSLLWNPCNVEPFTRLEFFFDDGGRLVYTDVRRFGTMYLVKQSEEVTGKLGIEPLGGHFTSLSLANLIHARSAPIKAVLLDQGLIAGIGNMYADEALFAAKIHPLRPSMELDKAEIGTLHKSIRSVLRKAIKNKGASIRNYRCPDGETGTAHEEFAVAHRAGERCPRCGTIIKRMVVRQRGTYYCPKCQKRK